MKNKLRTIGILCLFLAWAPCFLRAQESQTEAGVKFTEHLSWQQIVAKATAENKYIFVDCFATWCGPCKLMDREVYPKTNVGDFYNTHFISVRAQMDSSKNDNEEVRNWYADAHNLQAQFHIRAFPTFLFFSPDGKIVHRAVGAHRDTDFINLGKKALNPEKQYYTLLTNYRQGNKDFKKMVYLAAIAGMSGDKKLADTIAGDYKLNYLDKLSEEGLCTKENLDFIGQYPNLVNSKDGFFHLFYNSPEKADQIAGQKGLSDLLANWVISMEEIFSKLYDSNNKALTASPAWDAMTETIAKKYNRETAEKLVLDAKLKFYPYVGNWKEYAKWEDFNIIKNPPKSISEVETLNQAAWSNVFEHCKDKGVLTRAIAWSDLCIQLQPESIITSQFYDTKANLLYKLGKVNEAIVCENKAIDQDDQFVKKSGTKTGYTTGFYENLAKMKKGEPTWPEK